MTDGRERFLPRRQMMKLIASGLASAALAACGATPPQQSQEMAMRRNAAASKVDAGLIQSRQMRREHYASAYIVHASVIPLLTHRRKVGEETDDLQGSFERTPDFPDNE